MGAKTGPSKGPMRSVRWPWETAEEEGSITFTLLRDTEGKWWCWWCRTRQCELSLMSARQAGFVTKSTGFFFFIKHMLLIPLFTFIPDLILHGIDSTRASHSCLLFCVCSNEYVSFMQTSKTTAAQWEHTSVVEVWNSRPVFPPWNFFWWLFACCVYFLS